MSKFPIKPMKAIPTMDKVEAEKVWNYLSRAIDEIYNMNASVLSFEELYRYGYNLVLTKHGEYLYNSLTEKIRSHLLAVISNLEKSLHENLLKTLSEQWKHHKECSARIKDVLMYIDNTFVNQQKKQTIFNLGLINFREHVVYHPEIRSKITREILDVILLERQGNIIDQPIIASILSMLSELSIDGINVYEDEFERAFLHETKIYYREQSLLYLNTNNTPDYLIKVEERLHEEAQRIIDYLQHSTEIKLRTLVETELLETHAKTLLQSEKYGAHQLFFEDKMEDLRRLYLLFSRMTSCLDMLRDNMVNYVRNEGLRIVADQEKSNDPVLFMQRIFDLKAKFDVIIENCFKGDKKFSRRLKEALEDFINRDAKCSGYLAVYLDHILKTGYQNEKGESVEILMEKILIFFRYLNDKDVFEAFYRSHLAKRLLQLRSASEENEKLVVQKLKQEVGNQYTAKMEGMLTDMNISKTSMEEYKQTELFQSNVIELDATLLTAGYWPSQVQPSCSLSPALRSCQDGFTAFYTSTNSGRKLNWYNHMGNVEIRANYKNEKKHDFTVSTYQACILELFNTKAVLSLEEIRASTGIVEHELRRHLLSLCTPKVKILIKSSKDKDILDADEFTFNEDFTSKFRRIKVPLIVAKEIAADERESIPSNVEEERRLILDAVIVRIMKARKTSSHNQLLEEISHQVSNRFNPSPSAVKSRIESLIERDFLKRDEHDMRKYIYLA